MLKAETWQELAKRTGLEAEQLQEAITSETEADIELAPVNVFSDEQLDQLKATVGKESAKAGANTMIEMKVKELRDKYELDFEGKNIDNLLSAFADKQIKSAKIEPNKKVSDLTQSLENLQKTYTTDLAEKDSVINGYKSKLNEFKINGDLSAHLPEKLNGINQRQFMTLAKTDFNFDYSEDGQLIAKRNGVVIKDKLEQPIPVSDILSDYATKNGWAGVAGRNNPDEPGSGGGFKTLNDVYKHMEANKINPMSKEGVEMIAKFNKQ